MNDDRLHSLLTCALETSGKKRILDPWILMDPGGSWWILVDSVDPDGSGGFGGS